MELLLIIVLLELVIGVRLTLPFLNGIGIVAAVRALIPQLSSQLRINARLFIHAVKIYYFVLSL